MFTDYVAMYREAIAEARYADLPDLQPAPFANVAFGGAGTAYVLWRLGDMRRARAWATSSRADRRRSAYAATDQPAGARGSLHFGRLGVAWVSALVDRKRIPAFVRALVAPDGIELANGLAGHLTATRTLARVHRDASLRRAGERRAALLGEAVQALDAWPDDAGFAHGWPGVLHALLAWHGDDVPAWLARVLAARADAWAPRPLIPVAWCNGFAGSTMLWVRAYAATREPRYLELARTCARASVAATGNDVTLCCGDAGVASALLALATIDGPAWRAEARRITAAAIERAALRWPNGLYRGHPGLVCVALDCVADVPAGYPGVE